MQDLIKKSFTVDYSLPDFLFTVDGKEYSLRYDFVAFRAYEKVTGHNPLVNDFELSSDNLDTVLWAGLRSTSPDVTIEQVQKWLTPMTARGFLGLVGDAYFASFPTPDPENPPADPPTA